MARTKRQDKLTREGLDALFEEFYPRLFNYMYYRTLNRAISDDLVGDTMVNIVRAYETFDASKGNLEAWVFRIARNTLFSFFRKNKETTDIDSIPESFVAYEEEPELEDSGDQVRKMLALLNDEERELVFLKYWEELSNKEIGERLGMNASTVSTKLWRATSKMRAGAEKM